MLIIPDRVGKLLKVPKTRLSIKFRLVPWSLQLTFLKALFNLINHFLILLQNFHLLIKNLALNLKILVLLNDLKVS